MGEKKKEEEERKAEEERSREEEDKSEDEFSLLALTKPHKRFQYSDYRSGKYQKEQKKEEEKKRKEEEQGEIAESEKRKTEEKLKDVKRTEDSFSKLEPLIHPSPSLAPEPRTPMLTKAAKKDIPSMIADDFAQEMYQDAKPSLRRGKMIPCPLCGVEYALASNLEKHIDRDHREEGADDEGRGRRKRRGASSAVVKKRKRKSEEEEDVIVKKSKTEETEESSTSPVVQTKDSEVPKEEESEDKLTEYEIFQKLQMKEQKADRKRVECTECGLRIPTNTIKRHRQKHEKDAEKAKLLAENPSLAIPPPKPVSTKKKVPCPECGKQLPPNTLKRHIAKHKKTKEQPKVPGTPDQGLADERIPCSQCENMLPKNAMKRHLMKHETAGQDETDGAAVPIESKEKAKVVRKKVACQECGLLCAANVMKRHLEKHRKVEASLEVAESLQHEAYAPIEITPTKEYWEMNEQKKPAMPKPEPVKSTSLKKGGKGGGGRGKGGDQETREEKGKISEEEGEEESPLEIAVRKVVSYKMTPKQALSEYKLTPKVMCEGSAF